MRLSKQLKSNIQLLGVVTLLVLAFAVSNHLLLGKMQLCVWRSFCGLPCPGCGLTHAGIFLLSGDIRASLHWHPFLIPIVFTLVLSSLPSGWSRFADRFKGMNVFFILLIASTTGYFIYRLICFYPQFPAVGPMFYEPRNYMELLKNFLTGIF